MRWLLADMRRILPENRISMTGFAEAGPQTQSGRISIFQKIIFYDLTFEHLSESNVTEFLCIRLVAWNPIFYFENQKSVLL
jgi:hypothetical protein